MSSWNLALPQSIALAIAGSALFLVPACKNPLRPIENVRNAIAAGDTSPLASLPACDEMGKSNDLACLSSLATALGSTNGFQGKPPDQAAAGAVAVRVARDARAAAVSDSATWLSAMAGASGPGPDALRLAVAKKLAAHAADFGAHVDDEGAARRLMGVVGAAVPGACQLYTVLGSGVDVAALPIVEHPDHSPCVQADLTRANGPGAAYGTGIFRAAEGALALAKDAIHALHQGQPKADETAKPSLTQAISTADAAISACTLKKVAAPPTGVATPEAMDHVFDGGAAPLGTPAPPLHPAASASAAPAVSGAAPPPAVSAPAH